MRNAVIGGFGILILAACGVEAQSFEAEAGRIKSQVAESVAAMKKERPMHVTLVARFCPLEPVPSGRGYFGRSVYQIHASRRFGKSDFANGKIEWVESNKNGSLQIAVSRFSFDGKDDITVSARYQASPIAMGAAGSANALLAAEWGETIPLRLADCSEPKNAGRYDIAIALHPK